MTEDQLQAKCFQLTWNHFPELRRKFWAVPNGGHRDPITAKKLQATGVIPGVWDVHFFYRGTFFVVEFKVGNNQLSKPQNEWIQALADEGFCLGNRLVVTNIDIWKKFVWFAVLGKEENGRVSAEYLKWLDAK